MKRTSLLIAIIFFTVMLQAQVTKNLVVTAGGLKTALTTSELNTIAKLTLTGTIDARDFKTMRDDMPLLAEIDLSGVTISEYNGNGGTLIWGNYYPANTIPEYAFLNLDWQGKSSLTSFVFPATANEIGRYAFRNCNGLISISIPSLVKTIGNYAFYDCKGMVSISVPSSVTTIGFEVFSHCTALINVESGNPNYSSIDGVLYNKAQTKLIKCPISKAGSFIIPATVVTVGQTAFEYCEQLTSIVIPNSVKYIEYGAFRNCYSLISAVISSSVITIGQGFFEDCSSLASITVGWQIPPGFSSIYDAFYNVNKTTCTLYVPFGSKTAYQTAEIWQDFQNIIEMPGVSLSKYTLGMGVNAGSAIVVIKSSQAWTATSGESWLSINPVSGTTGSHNLVISVTENTGATRTANITVTAEGFEPQVLTVKQYGKIEVTAGNLKTLLAEELKIITSLTLTGTIDARDFKTMRDDMPLLAEIDLSGVTIVEYMGKEGTFSSVISTTYLANTIPERAFVNSYWQGKNSLTTFVFPTTATEIGENAFYSCNGLTSVSIPSSVKTIRNYAFYDCQGMVSISVPSSVTKIEYGVFSYCTALINVNAGNPNYSSIEGVLYNKAQTTLIQCPISKAGSFTIPATVVTVGEFAFEFCGQLTSIVIPNSVKYIQTGAFWGCYSLISAVIPSSVITIEDDFFGECSSLASITVGWPLPPDLSSIYDAFYNVNQTTCILYVPYGSKTAYQAAGIWQDFQNIVELPGVFLSKYTLDMGLNAGTENVIINSSQAWTATSGESWLSINPVSGTTGSHTLVISVTENTGATRTANITVTAAGFEPQTITVKQSRNIEVTAGNLKTLFAGQLGVITNLTLTGTIDARDFKTMRDDMPLLAEIDLSGVTIVEYYGNAGTSYGYNNYPANTIPEFAFYDGWYGKSSLVSFVFPTNATEIGEYAFRSCNGLTNVFIPSSMKTIGEYAFWDCSSLISAFVPSSVTTIGDGFFDSCISLASITVGWQVPPSLSKVIDAFYNVNKNTCVLYVPHGSKAAYQIAYIWKDFLNIVEIPEESTVCQTLAFKTGWNIFSAPNQPQLTGMDIVFLPCMTNNSLVKIQDESGSSMEDWGIYGGWKNYIGNVSPTEGYKVKVSKDDNLEVCGAPVKYPFAIPLKSGWNIMGYPQTSPFDALEVLQPLINSGKLVKVQDEAGNSIEDWGIYGGWKNYIHDFVPGKGYNIKLTADETLWINDSYPKSSSILPEVTATTHFKPAFVGNGLDHMNINLVGLPLNILQAGDELAVFDGTTCVGAVTLTSRNINNQSVSIAASAKDNQGMAGFAEGNPIMLKLWNSKQNTELILDPEIVKGTATFAKHETTVASLEKYATTGLEGISGNGLTEINCYPNPFSDEITVEIKLAKDSEVQVEVLNQLGQRVKFLQTEKMLNSGVHRLMWDGKYAENQQVSTGIYHLRIIVEDSILIRKLVYSK
jgi:hypothetical protein